MNSETIRKSKNSYIHVLLHKTNMRAHKEDLLSGYGVSSVTELSDTDIDALTERLQTLADTVKSNASASIRKQRSNVIIAAENYLGFRILGADAWGVFNKLLLNPKICGKMMWELNETELKALHQKLRSMGRKKQTKITNENRVAVQN
jgi:hypothetical protein